MSTVINGGRKHEGNCETSMEKIVHRVVSSKDLINRGIILTFEFLS